MNTPSGYCGFRLHQEVDADLQMMKTVAVHNCANYGVSLVLYLKPGDYEERTARELFVTDEDGNVTNENVLDECRNINQTYTMCKFYMAPDNKRMGFLSEEGAGRLFTYSARWASKR